MPTRPSQAAADIIADGRNVLAAAKAYAKQFKAYDAGRKKKVLDPAILTRLAANLAAATKATGAVTAAKASVGAATAKEVASRQKLFDALTQIREDVRLAYPDDKAMARAFGVGTGLSVKLTGPLLAAADSVAEAFADKGSGFAAQAKAAGVTSARMASLKRLRDALDAADASQGAGVGTRKGATTTKETSLAAIKKDVAHVRAAAKLVLRGDAKALAAFTSRVVRRAVRKRPPKPTPAPPPPAPAS